MANPLRFFLALAGLVAGIALAVACLWAATFDRDWALLRVGAVAVGFVVAIRSPGAGAMLVLALAPLSVILARLWIGTPLILAEHVLCGVLPVCAFRVFTDRRALHPGPAGVAAIALLAVVCTSVAGILLDYRANGVAPSAFLLDGILHHFSFGIGDIAVDRRSVLHEGLLLSETLGFFLLLTSGCAALGRGRVAAVVSGGAAISVLVALHQAAWGWGDNPFQRSVQPGLARLTSTLGGSNAFGAYLVLVAPVVFAWLVSRRRHGAALAAWTWMALAAWCLVGTVSRAAWGGAFVATILLGLVVWRRPDLLGFASHGVVPRLAGALALVLPVSLVVAVAVATLADLGREVSYRGATRSIDAVFVTLNLRRPRSELLPARVEHWLAAIDLWKGNPVLGAGIGRYRIGKLAPVGGVVDEGPGGAGKGISVPGAETLFARWVNGVGGADFVAADVLPGDTLESRGGGWGPVVISGRFSANQLTLEETAPPAGRNLDYVIRHPPVDYLRPHAHDAMKRHLPSFTSAHNNFLLILSELGLVGLTVFLALVGCLFVEIAGKTSRGVREETGLVVAAGLGLVALLTSALAQDPLASFGLGCVFWAVAAMVALPANDEASSASRARMGSSGDTRDGDSHVTTGRDRHAAPRAGWTAA
jgi:O-antigen ligase